MLKVVMVHRMPHVKSCYGSSREKVIHRRMLKVVMVHREKRR